jgi:hypothetical protein
VLTVGSNAIAQECHADGSRKKIREYLKLSTFGAVRQVTVYVPATALHCPSMWQFCYMFLHFSATLREALDKEKYSND